jgi:hypothetical protein
MPEITEKKCRQCGEIKPRDAFYKNKNSADGLTLYCGACLKIKQAKYRKRYTKNGYVSLSDSRTYELHNLQCTCEKCEKRNRGIYENQQGKGESGVAEILGIHSWKQVDSVVREMAELQSGIDDEGANCEKRISLIKKYSDELIEPLLTHQIALQSMLLNFLKKDGRKRLIRKYDFGVIKLFDGQLKIQLDVGLAKQRMGKP